MAKEKQEESIEKQLWGKRDKRFKVNLNELFCYFFQNK